MQHNGAMSRLVLLPGLACDERLWQAQRPALPPHFDVRVADVHARHDRIEGMAAAVLAENEGRLILCGASLGGMIAMEAARQAPERIVGLALLGTSARPETPEMFQLRESAIELFERGEARDVIEFNAGFAFHPAQAADKALVRRYVEMVLHGGAAQLIRQNRAVMQRPDARQHLPQVRCPALVLCGREDAWAPLARHEAMAAAIPGSTLAVIEECGHMAPMERPGEVAAALAAWLARVAAASRAVAAS